MLDFSKLVGALSRWYTKGTLELKTAAATPIIEDVRRMSDWLNVKVALVSFGLPMDAPEAAELPLVYRDIGCIFEEFRPYALPELGANWTQTLPRVPLNKDELKTVLTRQLERDEMLVIRQLSVLDSLSAGIIVQLDLTRDIVKAALAMLQTNVLPR